MKIPKPIFMILGFLLGIGSLFAQNGTLSPKSTCILSGTSTLASWTADVSKINGTLNLGDAFSGPSIPDMGTQVEGATISIPVDSITGARGDAMTTKIHNAFKHTEHPEIVFELSSGSITQITDAAAGTFVITAQGKLTMAGVEKEISVPFNGKRLENGGYQFECVYKIKMTDYNIEPPSAMFGQIVCGDEVSVIFNLLTK